MAVTSRGRSISTTAVPLITLLVVRAQRFLYIPGRTVYYASGGDRYDGKTDAKDGRSSLTRPSPRANAEEPTSAAAAVTRRTRNPRRSVRIFAIALVADPPSLVLPPLRCASNGGGVRRTVIGTALLARASLAPHTPTPTRPRPRQGASWSRSPSARWRGSAPGPGTGTPTLCRSAATASPVRALASAAVLAHRAAPGHRVDRRSQRGALCRGDRRRQPAARRPHAGRRASTVAGRHGVQINRQNYMLVTTVRNWVPQTSRLVKADAAHGNWPTLPGSARDAIRAGAVMGPVPDRLPTQPQTCDVKTAWPLPADSSYHTRARSGHTRSSDSQVTSVHSILVC